MKVICQICELSLKPEVNGVIVVELYNSNESVYRIWMADSLRCPVCGMLAVSGFGDAPVMTSAMYSEEQLRGHIKRLEEKGNRIVYHKEMDEDQKRIYHKRLARQTIGGDV